jgi:hypothetical protein
VSGDLDLFGDRFRVGLSATATMPYFGHNRAVFGSVAEGCMLPRAAVGGNLQHLGTPIWEATPPSRHKTRHHRYHSFSESMASKLRIDSIGTRRQNRSERVSRRSCWGSVGV